MSSLQETSRIAGEMAQLGTECISQGFYSVKEMLMALSVVQSLNPTPPVAVGDLHGKLLCEIANNKHGTIGQIENLVRNANAKQKEELERILDCYVHVDLSAVLSCLRK